MLDRDVEKFVMDQETQELRPQANMLPPPAFSQSTVHFNYAYVKSSEGLVYVTNGEQDIIRIHL